MKEIMHTDHMLLVPVMIPAYAPTIHPLRRGISMTLDDP